MMELGMAVCVDAVQRYEVIASTEDGTWFDQRLKLGNNLIYGFNSSVVLTGAVVVVSTILLRRAGRAAGITDKVVILRTAAVSIVHFYFLQIANTMLFVVIPLYTAYTLSTLIFTIVFSDSGLPNTSSQTTLESATVANNLLLLSSYFAVSFMLVLMSANRANWNIQGGTVQPGMSHVVENYLIRSLTIDGPQKPMYQCSNTGHNLPNRMMGRSNMCNPTTDSQLANLCIIIMSRNRRLCSNTRCPCQRYTAPRKDTA